MMGPKRNTFVPSPQQKTSFSSTNNPFSSQNKNQNQNQTSFSQQQQTSFSFSFSQQQQQSSPAQNTSTNKNSKNQNQKQNNSFSQQEEDQPTSNNQSNIPFSFKISSQNSGSQTTDNSQVAQNRSLSFSFQQQKPVVTKSNLFNKNDGTNTLNEKSLDDIAVEQTKNAIKGKNTKAKPSTNNVSLQDLFLDDDDENTTTSSQQKPFLQINERFKQPFSFQNQQNLSTNHQKFPDSNMMMMPANSNNFLTTSTNVLEDESPTSEEHNYNNILKLIQKSTSTMNVRNLSLEMKRRDSMSLEEVTKFLKSIKANSLFVAIATKTTSVIIDEHQQSTQQAIDSSSTTRRRTRSEGRVAFWFKAIFEVTEVSTTGMKIALLCYDETDKNVQQDDIADIVELNTSQHTYPLLFNAMVEVSYEKVFPPQQLVESEETEEYKIALNNKIGRAHV